jgi:peptide methionine sulfoxide reductase msrA/msrB
MLTPEESYVIEHKGTEPPFSGEYNNFYYNGVYVCRRCGEPLYRSMDKFDSGCGWPSFDDDINLAVKQAVDADGRRTEILCQHCDAHLGHIFHGEKKTPKDTRHCVNSLAMQFISFDRLLEQALSKHSVFGVVIVAGGCFWGLEYFFELEYGVLATACGYTGGTKRRPSYRDVCRGTTGHAEAVAIIYDKSKTNLTALLNLFFDIHNPTEKNRQGPDVGTQYRSALFPIDEAQKKVFKDAIADIDSVVTTIEPYEHFWMAEEGHQHYFRLRNEAPTCHYRRTRK